MRFFLIRSCFIITILIHMSFAQQTPKAFENMLSDLLSHTIPAIAPETLYAQGTERYLLLDTRAVAEYKVSHLAGATHVDYASFSPAVLEGMDRNKPVVLYCSVGYRSEKIGEKLLEAGFQEVYNLYGGIFAWKNAGYPVQNNASLPTDSVHTYNEDWSKWLFKGEKVY